MVDEQHAVAALVGGDFNDHFHPVEAALEKGWRDCWWCALTFVMWIACASVSACIHSVQGSTEGITADLSGFRGD